ncbi:hypothetical protein NPIL_341261 [Nephila pilipes]|uniref:Uncharacterized protein n=1 Tax=Nephila pilipes TaxID=299642 RepID=A0A8X6KGW2_NEPPI|nr:hypothetical protein NPIL_341261 [Nephila pilipes]
MFIQDIHDSSLSDLDAFEQNSFLQQAQIQTSNTERHYIHSFIEEIKKKSRKCAVTVRETVTVGADKKNNYLAFRLNSEIIPDKDGQVRLC